MSNIISYGLALPKYRISDETLTAGKPRKSAKRTVVYTDEDVLTLAYEAAFHCLENTADSSKPEAVFFSTTSPVFKGRYHASQLSDWLNLPHGLLALDFCSSSRSGTDALIMADRLITAGTIKSALVVASDGSFPEIGNELKDHRGHGACAIVLGTEKGMAFIDFTKSMDSGFADVFNYKTYPVNYDSRFGKDAGLKNDFALALDTWQAHLNNKKKASFRFILNANAAKVLKGQIMKAGINEQVESDVLLSETGHLGAAHALFRLIDSLKNVGTPHVLFDACNGINIVEYSVQKSTKIDWAYYWNLADNVRTYQDYLLLRKAAATGRDIEVKDMFSSEMISEREKESLIHLRAYRCKKCNSIFYLRTARCKHCHESTFDELTLSRTGEIYTYTNEHYYPASFPPVVMLVMNLDSGGRMTVQQTDDMYKENENLIGLTGELVLRKMNEHDNKPNYFWKCRIGGVKNIKG